MPHLIVVKLHLDSISLQLVNQRKERLAAERPSQRLPRLAERLLANLVDNALAYNSAPGRIDVMTGRRGDVVLLSITNTGAVVDAGAVDRLTQPFERLETERTGHGDGSGLGLSIVQAIVNAHAGSLTLRPRYGGGLTVEATFPSWGTHIVDAGLGSVPS